ncbi:MAG: DUF3794 domain-containing protein [Clostridia bacterium]|nr:DUF3794 domain-containing protein [Clostridia bacterium]
MSFEKSRCNFIKKTKLKDEQIMLDSVINNLGSGEMQKLIWINAFPQIDNIEPLTKEVSISGKANLEIIFLNDENKISITESSIPFLTKFINDNVNPSTKVSINATVNDLSFNETNSKVSAIMNFSVDTTNISELELINGGDENICLKEDEIVSQSLLKDDCINFNEEFSITINEQFDRILSVCSDVIVKDVDCRDNFFVVQGEIITKVYYIVCGETEKICFVSNNEGFKREIEAPSLTENACVEIDANIKKENIKYEQEISDNTCKIIITAPIDLCFKAYEEFRVPCAKDLYSIRNNIEIINSAYEKTKIIPPIYFENKIEGNISLNEKEPRIDKLLGVSKGNLKPTNQYIKNGEIVLEGIVSVEIAYLNDELQAINCVRRELPYVISEKIDVSSGFKICAKEVLSDVDVIARRGRELFLDAKIKAYVKVFGVEKGEVITDAIMGEPLPAKEDAIEIYFGKTGDDLWEIAKELRTHPEVIIEQNPDLVSPLLQNSNIVIYYQKKPNPTSLLLAKNKIEY